jgi:ABC-type lipoprotein export system ATPase subunit
VIHCEQLTKIYRRDNGDVRSLDGVSLEVRPGEFLCVRGPSGCGKTTLLLTMGGMLRPSAGRACVDGQDLYALDTRQRARFRSEKIGFIFQMFHLVPYLNVLENVLLAASTRSNGAAPARATELLTELGLAPRLHHTPAELSAGERQRAAIARALFNRPKLVLADEPTGNLDPDNAHAVFRHLREFQRGGGTVVVVTHGSTAEEYADRIIEMRAGKILEKG